MRWILRALLVVAAVAIAWLGIVWSGVLPRVTPEQRAALAFLREMSPPPPGRNAFALLWAQPWAVPEGQEETLLAEDLARFADWEARWVDHQRRNPEGDTDETIAAFESIAAERHGRRARLPDGKDWLCDAEWDADCLAAVAKNPDAARAALEAVSDSIALAERLAQFDHVRNPFPPSFLVPIVGYGDWARIALNVAALRAEQGDMDAALEELCRFGNTWRRLRTGADSLLSEMVGIAWVTIAVQNALAFGATSPVDSSWPSACGALLAPLSPTERDQCNAMRNEFAGLERGLRLFEGIAPTGALPVPENFEHSLALFAQAYAPTCPAISAGTAEGCALDEWVFNPAGCRLLGPMAGPQSLYASYAERLRDLDRRLALARAARWWRAQPGASTAETPVWPDEFAAIRAEITIDAATRTLSLPMRDTSNPKRLVFRVRY